MIEIYIASMISLFGICFIFAINFVFEIKFANKEKPNKTALNITIYGMLLSASFATLGFWLGIFIGDIEQATISIFLMILSIYYIIIRGTLKNTKFPAEA